MVNFEDFKDVFDQSFNKVTAAEFLLKMEERGYQFVGSQPTHPHFWYMLDNHTFISIKGKNLDDICIKAVGIAKANPYGMLCPVSIMRGDKELRRVGQSVHVRSDGKINLTAWLEEVSKEPCVKNYKG